MRYSYLAFWGVPCCERLFAPRIKSVLQSSHYLVEAQTPIQADLLIVFGHITHKQAPYLQNLWADFVYPSRSIHFAGCKKALSNYALIDNLQEVLIVETVVRECEIDEKTIEKALELSENHHAKKIK